MPPRRINSTAIRQLNLVRVFHALRENPGSSQRALGRITGLDKATISAIVGQLLEQGVLERGHTPSTGRVGRPEVALSIAPSAGSLVGARLEPGLIRIVATTLAGTPLRHIERPGSTDITRALQILHGGIEELIDGYSARAPVRAVGIGIPALMDRQGRLVLAPNLGWRDVPILPMLQKDLPVPVYVDNDTKAAAIGERLFGTCRDVNNFVYLAGHSGLGASIFTEGRLYRGQNGFAGEIGHMTVVPDGRQCGCGKRGCLETYVSEKAILQTAREQGCDFDDLFAVARAAEAREPRACRLLDEVGHYLGFALASVGNMIDPELVVLSGNLAIVADHVLPALKRTLDQHTLPPVLANLQVSVSPFGEDAVPMGGIALAMEGLLSTPWLNDLAVARSG